MLFPEICQALFFAKFDYCRYIWETHAHVFTKAISAPNQGMPFYGAPLIVILRIFPEILCRVCPIVPMVSDHFPGFPSLRSPASLQKQTRTCPQWRKCPGPAHNTVFRIPAVFCCHSRASAVSVRSEENTQRTVPPRQIRPPPQNPHFNQS